MIRTREKEATWGIATIAWLCGWIAARRFSWDALMMAAGAVCYLLVLERLSVERFPAIFLPHHRRRLEAGVGLFVLLVLFLAWAIARLRSEEWIMAIIMPGLLYGSARVLSLDRLEVFAFLGIAIFTSFAPATYMLVAPVPSAEVALTLWGFLGAYFVLSGLLLRAKVSGSIAIVRWARLTSVGFLVGSLFLLRARPSITRGLIAAVFFLGALRVWCYRSNRPVNLTRLESRELSYDALAALAIDAAILLA